MIVRIVKMTFQPEKVDAFLSVFDASKGQIRNFPGCKRLELYRERPDGNVLFTYSFWESDNDLQAYRKSALFQSTWAKTKVLFLAKAEAWSLEQLHYS